MSEPLWAPSAARIARAGLSRFIADAASEWGAPLTDYASLYRFSIERPADFWQTLWRFSGVAGDRGPRIVEHLDRMPGARFFPDARLNFTENLLRRRDDGAAILFRDDAGRSRTVSWNRLHDDVVSFAAGLKAAGVRTGDRVAGYLPNIPETIVAALGTAAIGAIWSSCSPDFGVQGVLDRFGQIAPTVLVCADGYSYGGRTYDSRPRVDAVARALPSLVKVVVVPHIEEDPDLGVIPGATSWAAFLETVTSPRSHSNACRSITRSTSCSRRERRASRSASCTAPVARCSSTSRSTAFTATSIPVTACSTSPPAAG